MDVRGVDAGLLQTRYRLTKQRAAILRALDGGTHLSAETILERVREELPGVSLGTIYRTLDILRELGLVQVFSFAGSASRFEAVIEKHHHLLCIECRQLVNVAAPGLNEIAQAIGTTHHFGDVDASLTITGRCPACFSNGKTKSSNN
ncbi:MAG: transcriptional repressor [Candidatus Eremiobacteraeota bacterium]|nr:transcriptional repressor [Candidatus Eremiobacteraeota bacterium]